MKTLKTFIFFFLLLLSAGAWAYSTPNVPVDDPVYRDIDKLVASGLVKDAIYGQRPWSRREIARMVADAMRKQAEFPPPIAPDSRELDFRANTADILGRLKNAYREELVDQGALDGEAKSFRFHPLEEVRFDLTALDGGFRKIPPGNGIGFIDASVNPLVANREGRHYAEGVTLGLETSHRAKLTRFFSIYARPRFEALLPTTGSSDFNPLVQQLYGKFNVGKFELEVGRDSLVWGQGEFGGLLFSNNARPLDMIKISNDVPFFHPWIFRYLGPSKYTFFIANLGPEREFPHSFLYGLHISIQPVSFLELGLDHSIVIGGDGAPGISWFDPLSEFFFVRKGGLRGQGSQVADQRFGFNWRLRLPVFRRTDWYFEALWDDLGRQTLSANITQLMAFTSGFYFPLLTPDGSADLRIEYAHIPPILYRHSVFTSGYALNGLVLGEHDGPDSDRLSVIFRQDIGERLKLKLESHYANFDSDTYDQTFSSNGAPDTVFKTSNRPTEHRLGFGAGLTWQTNRWLRTQMDFGYEYVRNADFNPQDNTHNFLGGLTFVATPLF